MREIRKIISRVESAIKKLDPKVIVQRTFYDEASDRLYVSLVKGSRKHELTLYGYRFDDSAEIVNRALKEEVERLQHVPIG